MKIIIDSAPLFNQKTGVGYYTYNLIKYLLTLQPSNEYILYDKYSNRCLKVDEGTFEQINEEIASTSQTTFEYYSSRVRSKLQQYLWGNMGVSLFDISPGVKADIAHGVNFHPIPSNFGKSVITIHDLYFLINPQHLGRLARITLPREINNCAKRASFILTVSECTRQDVLSKLDVRPEKVKSIPNAAGPHFTFLNDEVLNQNTRERYTGGAPYILYLGTLEPRKNLVRLIHAFSLLKSKGLPHKLLMAGRRGWLYEDIFTTIEKLGLQENVVTPDYVPEKDLVPLYNAAEVFVFPSLYEGFGIPALEAMACGTPVIASNSSSLPEVIEDAGILIHPEDVDGFAASIEKLVNDRSFRESLRSKGLEQAKKFSWERTARETLDVYSRLI